jgi:hypothetical protein
MLKRVHLSGVACALTQLLALAPPKSLGLGLLQPQTMPWRRPTGHLSVRQMETLLRQAAALEWTSSLAAYLGLPLRKAQAQAGATSHGRGKVLSHRLGFTA